MKLQNKLCVTAIALALGVAFSAAASASPAVMNFDGISNVGDTSNGGQLVNGYYNGGCTAAYQDPSLAPSCNGPNYGVTWENAIAGGTGNPNALWNVANLSPSPSNAIGFLTGNDAVMSVTNGFGTAFSFFYTAFAAGNVVLNGTQGGNPWTTTMNLGATATCGAAPCWAKAGITLPSDVLVTSANFGGSANNILFDNVTLGANIAAVPEPAALGMFGLGALLIGGFVGLRKRFD